MEGSRLTAKPTLLLERELELERLCERIDAALVGEGSTVALEGEAGVGKSSLMACAVQRASAAGMRVLSARGGELERGFAHGVVRQLFEAPLTSMTPPERERLLGGAAGLAASALSISQPRRGPGGDAGAVLHGLYWLSANLAGEQPLLIAVDDAHWADDASLRFVSYLARRVHELPLLILYAARTGEGGCESLPAAAEPDLVSAVLRPFVLSAAATGELIGQLLGGECSPEFARACLVATGGNPFLVHELLRALVAEGIAPDDESIERVARLAPQTIARAILARLRRLGPAASRLALAVAVLGARAELRHAAALAGLELDRAGEAADALTAAAILRDGRPLEFIHPIVRTTVYAEIPPAKRAASHKRAVALLEQDGAAPEALAAHLLATEPAGDRRVVEQLRAAARAVAADGAPDAACTYLERARAEPPPAEDRLEVLLELGAVEARAARPDAVAHLREAFARAADAHTRVKVADELVFALTTSNRVPEAVELLWPAIAQIADADDEGALQIEARLALVAQLDSATAKPARERLARYEGRLRGDSPAERMLLASMAFDAAHRPEAPQRAAELAELALADGGLIAEQPPDSAAPFLAAWALVYSDRLDRAERYFDLIGQQARAHGVLPHFATAAGSRCHVLLRQGRIAETEAEARSAMDASRLQPWLIGRSMLIAALLGAMVERADTAACEALLEENGLDDELPPLAFAGMVLFSRGHLRLAAGDARAALRDFEQIRRRDEESGLETAAIPTRASAALAHAQLGEHEIARALAQEELDRARRWGAASALSFALRTAGVVRRGDPGIELLREAAAVVEHAPARLERARSLTELGAALRRAGHRRDAREPLREALELAHRCGAQHLARRAREELVAAGARPRRIRLTGLESLTASERRVAQLAAEGHANRDIAQALFVTVRTVEGHLTQTYAKLGVASRERLAAALHGEAAGVVATHRSDWP